jgi:hypothetical protein
MQVSRSENAQKLGRRRGGALVRLSDWPPWRHQPAYLPMPLRPAFLSLSVVRMKRQSAEQATPKTKLLLFGRLLHVAVPANVSTFLVNEVFLVFRLVDPALLDMLDVS